jgi:type II secretory pathway component GspD/PulD (secretin)
VQTFYAQGAPQQITELSTALRALFELRFLATNPSQGLLTIRAPGPTLRAVARLLEDLQDDRPGVMLDIRIFQLSTSFTRDLGISVPNEFTIFNVPTEIRNVVGGGNFQQILAALQASGQSVNASTILAALLATGSATPLATPFATFGGGITLTGVTIPSTTLHFNDTKSVARTLSQSLLRSQHGSAATLKVGQRYPIITTVYSASTAQSSLLSSFGISTPGLSSSVSVPSPQFSYEDLGLVLKATPQVHGTLISVEYELALRAIGTTQANGPPVITNRESKGTISTEDGQPVVIAGLVDRAETASMSGIPALAAVPVLGRVTGVRNKQKLADELLIVITPRITLQRGERGIYIPLPTNVAK